MKTSTLLTLHRAFPRVARFTATRWLAAGTALGLLLCAGFAQASTFSVNNTSDSGAGSLREAIVAANANSGPDTIQFNIPGPGVKMIQLASALPPITDPVNINGYNPETPTLRTEIHGEFLPPASVVVDGVSYYGVFGSYYGSSPVSGPLAVLLDPTSPYGGLSLAGEPLPPGSLDGKIALVSRGTYTFDTKVSNVQAAGAIGVIVVNREGGGEPFVMGSDGLLDPITAFMVGVEDRTALMSKHGTQASLTPPIYGIEFGTGSAECSVAGLVIHGFSRWGMHVTSSATVTVDDCVVRNNYLGGIENFGMLTLTRSTLSSNSGSALDNWANAQVNNCAVTDNADTTTEVGAGLYNAGTMTVENTIFSGNKAEWGGGIYNYGTLTLTKCAVTGNRGDFGGGIWNEAPGVLTITGSRIIGNTATTSGGGLFAITWEPELGVFCTTTITDSVVNENQVNSSELAQGGGISCESAVLSLTKCNVNSNQANGVTANGGGICLLNSTATVQGSNVNGNQANGTAAGHGGGIYAENIAPTIVGSRVKGNKASTAFDNIFVSP